jgi:cold shock CspA family protein
MGLDALSAAAAVHEQQRQAAAALEDAQVAAAQQQQQQHLLAMQAMASASQDSWSQPALSSFEGVSDFLVNEDDTAKAEADTHIGVIARFDDKHGYGFIKCSTTWPRFSRDVFLHRMYFRHLAVGDIVSFQLLVNDRGQPQARRIRKLEGQAARHVESQLTSLGSIDQVYYIGLVARFDMDKGYGFLACDATKVKYGRDVFLRKVLYAELGLQVGDAVHFQVELNEKGFPQARNIMKMDQQSAEALALAGHLGLQPVQTSAVPPPAATSNQEVRLPPGALEYAGVMAAEHAKRQKISF